MDEETDRGSTYRRRLLRAAAASFALHMLLFGNLSIVTLDFATPDAHTSAASRKPKRPAADFRLQVSRSPEAEKPAQERPLDIRLAPLEAQAVDRRDREPRRNVAAEQLRPEEKPAEVAASTSQMEPQRPRDTAASPAVTESPQRRMEAAPAEASAAVDAAQTVAAVAAAPPAAAPAAGGARESRQIGRVAGDRRPREVALLERLTAPAPDASSLSARQAPSPAAAPTATGSPARRSTAVAEATSDVRADDVTPPAAVTAAASATALSPASRENDRRPPSRSAASERTSSRQPAESASDAPAVTAGSVAATPSLARQARVNPTPSGGASDRPASSQLSRQSSAAVEATGGPAAGVEPPTVAVAVGQAAEGGSLAPAAQATAARVGRRTTGDRSALSGEARVRETGSTAGDTVARAIAAGPGSAGVAAEIGGGPGGRGEVRERGPAPTPRPLGRDTGGLAAAEGSGGGAASLPAETSIAAGVGGAGEAGLGERLGPAPVAAGRRSRVGPSAIASPRSGAGTAGESLSGIEEGLSVSPADLAGSAPAGRRGDDLPERPAGPRSPARIMTAALPVDGRVRDVAEAFAGRWPAVGQPAGGIAEARDLDRARTMVERGLEFLARSQLADGRWRLTEFAGVTEADVPKLDSDTAATGLALLCFFGAGHDHFDGKHRDTVRRGLDFLLSVQKPDGDLFLPADDLSNSCGWLYSHGIAAIAVCEAVGMTGDPLVKPAAEKACRFIADTRHPTLGGWRYVPRTDADLSVSGWMLVALRAGELAGVKTDPAALDGVRTLLAASAKEGDATRFAYNPRKPDQRRTDLSVACMTAVGTLMRLHTGAAAADPQVAAAAAALVDLPPAYGSSARNSRDAYLWYYASQVLVHTGGEPWKRWYGRLADTLEPEQRREGPLAGSWDPTGPVPDRWGPYGGRVYVTALHLLALEVPWRYLPTYAAAPGR